MVDLKLSFDPMTIEHLGFKMYSHLPNAVAELVANAYDADATSVTVRVQEESGVQSVEVADNGHGMGEQDLADKYLRIGRNRRTTGGERSESGRRQVAGRKGLGKLALFGIGDTVTVRTKRIGSSTWNVVRLNWDELKQSTGGEYRPTQHRTPASPAEHGTVILVENLRRKTTVSVPDLARSLARLFNYVDADFDLTVKDARQSLQVTRDLRYGSIQVEHEWQVPKDLDPDAFATEHGIHGRVISSVKPLPADMRGITLYVHGRMAHEPEYFGVAESSYAFSYLTGYLDVDFVDELPDDLIATDRRSISWESGPAEELRAYLGRLLREVADKRRVTRGTAKRKRLQTDLGVNPVVWSSTIRGPEAGSVQNVLEVLTSPDSEIADDDRREIVQGLQGIAPEYADLHWRNLHPSIRDAAGTLYENEHYAQALVEAVKRYVRDVRALVAWPDVDKMKDHDVLQRAFSEAGVQSGTSLDVFASWLDSGFSPDTAKNVRECQRSLSIGVVQGFRNPLAHEEVARLQTEGVLTYQDCLDALSILSHLRRRLDGAASCTAPALLSANP